MFTFVNYEKKGLSQMFVKVKKRKKNVNPTFCKTNMEISTVSGGIFTLTKYRPYIKHVYPQIACGDV